MPQLTRVPVSAAGYDIFRKGSRTVTVKVTVKEAHRIKPTVKQPHR